MLAVERRYTKLLHHLKIKLSDYPIFQLHNREFVMLALVAAFFYVMRDLQKNTKASQRLIFIDKDLL